MSGSELFLRAFVFLGLSVDGRIARPDGDLEWLTSRGEAAGDAGFTPFLESVDSVVMGRKTYEAIASYDDWPYLDRPIHVISTTLAAEADSRIILW
jgi:dihydrofolate reductase